MGRAVHAILAVMACLIAIAFAGLLFWTALQIALEASDQLRRYRPDGPRLSATSDDKSVFHSGGNTK